MKTPKLHNRLVSLSLRTYFVVLAVVCATLGGCFPGYSYRELYKPVEVIRANKDKELESRSYPVSVPDGVVNLEWFTYDNKDITKGPYKLFVWVEPSKKSLQRVEIVRITVTSSLGNRYEFDPSQKWPVVLDFLGPEKLPSHTLEPAFDFAYHKNEIIRTEILLRITTENGVSEQLLKTDWGPVLVRMFLGVV